MDTFYGQYWIIMEDNGRIKLPAGLRSNDEEPFIVLVPGHDQTLYGYNKVSFEEKQAGLLEKPLRLEDARLARRLLFGKAAIVKIDDQGRITIPKEFVGVLKGEAYEKQLVVVGAGDHFEIWRAQDWQEYIKQHG